MTDAPLTAEDEMDMLAAEYVLGVQDLAARLEAQRRIARDPAFALRVAAWEERLSGLNDGFAELPAPSHLLPEIEARLFGRPDRASARLRDWRLWLGGAVAAAAGEA